MARVTQTLKTLFKLLMYKTTGDSEALYDFLVQAAKELGGLYVKFIQFAALRFDQIPPEQKVRFLIFYDSVPYDDIDVAEVLNQEGISLESFEFISEEPFASGSLGQVYEARLKGGTNVIIKVKRPGIESDVKSDLRAIKAVAKTVSAFYKPAAFDIKEFVEEFARTTMQELDFEKEAENAVFFYKVFKEYPDVVIPKTYLKLSTQNVIVQEKVTGVPLTELLKRKLKRKKLGIPREDLRKILQKIYFYILIQPFILKRYFADPHPGNVMILDKNRFAFVDFGLVGYAPENLRLFFELFELGVKGVKEIDYKELAKRLLMFGAPKLYYSLRKVQELLGEDIITPIIKDYGVVLKDEALKHLAEDVTGRLEFSKLLLKGLNLGEKYGIKMPSNVLNALRANALYQSYNDILLGRFSWDPREVVRKMITLINKDLLPYQEEYKDISLEAALEYLSGWLSHFAEKDPFLYNKLAKKIAQINV